LCLRQELHSQHKHKYATANPPFPILQLFYQHCCDAQLKRISTLSTKITSKHNIKVNTILAFKIVWRSLNGLVLTEKSHEIVSRINVLSFEEELVECDEIGQ
jgi:hypothetical protein